MYIYLLKLEYNKYYIGKTDNNPEFRIQQHTNGNGAAWTKKYKVLEIIDIIQTESKYDEDKYTLEYMEKYGIDNVRGGTYCKTRISDIERRNIQKCIEGANNKCYRCGRNNHFIRNCYAKYHVNGYVLKDERSVEKNDSSDCIIS